jgi:hypothetical protein
VRGKRVLTIQAVVLETISKHSDTFEPTEVSTFYGFMYNACTLMADSTTRENRDSSEWDDIFELLAYSLSAGRDDVAVVELCLQYVQLVFLYTQHNTTDSHDLTTQMKELSRLDDIQSDVPDGSPQEMQNQGSKAIIKAALEAARYCSKRKVFLIRSGLLGIGARTLLDGDIIAVSTHSQWPVILRLAEHAGPDHCTPIGAAFVQGVRDEENIHAAAAQGEGIGTIHLV